MATSESISPAANPENRACIRICPKFSYGLMLLGLIALAASGIGTFALGKAPMTHWILMLHVGASPLFALGLTLVALTWPARCAAQNCANKLFFWFMLLCGLVVILSGVVPMTPVFGTEGQHFLYLAHRYSGIVMAGLVILHLLSLSKRKTA